MSVNLPLYEVSANDIGSLAPTPFRDLLYHLLLSEISLNSLKVDEFNVPVTEYTSDGGEDGRLFIKGSFPKSSMYIKNDNNIYQVKAMKLDDTNCAKEVVKTKKIENEKGHKVEELKPQVKEALENNCTYNLFIKKDFVQKGLTSRKNSIKKKFTELGFPDAEVEIFDGNIIAKWVNKFPAVVRYVKFCLGKDPLKEFLIIDSVLTQRQYAKYFVSTDALERKKEQILNELTANEQAAIRVTGNSGIGKTHFIAHLISSQNSLKSITLYIDLANYEMDISTVINFINNHQNHYCVLIIDNCSLEKHDKIDKIRSHNSLIKLITIDSNTNTNTSFNELRAIELCDSEQSDIVRQILEPVLQALNGLHYLNQLVNICGGYPLFAQIVSRSVQDFGIDKRNLKDLVENNRVAGLLFNVLQKGSKEILVVYALSFFTQVRFWHKNLKSINMESATKDIIKSQSDFIYNYFLQSKGITKEEFRTTCNNLIDRSILECKGSFIKIKPLPLAIRVLKEALQQAVFDFDETIKPALDELAKQGSPEHVKELANAFLAQIEFSMLSDDSDLKTYVNMLWGSQSPFAQAENLLTSWGIFVLRRITKIAPHMSIQILNKALLPYSTEDLLQIEGGVRRNLIFVLEYLCLHKETFETASEIMFRFALAENEAWANNSTGLFISLFKLYLAGTEANYVLRIKVLNNILKNYHHSADKIIIKSIAQGFYLGTYVRMSEARLPLEKLSDYQPATNGEVVTYWHNLIDIILELIKDPQKNMESIMSALNDIILHSLLKAKMIDQINVIIGVIQNKYPDQKFIETINRLKNYKEYDEEIDHKQVDSLISYLSPTKLIDKIELSVINKKYLINSSVALEQESIEQELVEVLIKEKTNQLIIIRLIESNTYNTLEFGKKIAENNSDYGKQLLQDFTNVYTGLNSIEDKTPFFIMGIIYGLNDRNIFLSLVDALLKKKMYKLAFEVTKMYQFTFEDFAKLVSIAKVENLPAQYFVSFHFQNLPLEDKLAILNILWPMSDVCKSKCIEIVSFNLNNEEDGNTLLSAIWTFIEKDNVFTLNLNAQLDYQVNLIMNKLLDRGRKYAEVIAHHLYEYADKNKSSYPQTYYWNNLFGRLINEYYELMWSKYLGKIFLHSWSGEFFIIQILSNRKLNVICDTAKKIEKMLAWCERNQDTKAHVRIARNILLRIKLEKDISPLGDDNSTSPSKWNDAIIALLYKYDDDDFLNAIITNLLSCFLAGEQASSYYNACARYLNELKGKFTSRIDSWIIEESRKLYLLEEKNKHAEDEILVISESHT